MRRATTLAIIPARGGSKGLPRKNVLPVAGRPLIAWTIAAASAAASVDRVVVSTDDAEIAAVARACGAEVVDRPADLSGDAASSESALLHALAHLRNAEGYRPDLTVFLQCTSPLTVAEDVDGTVAALLTQDADAALAVSPFHYFLWTPAGEGINHDRRVRLRRQDREPQYVETGAVYAMRTAGFLQSKHRFFGKTVTHVTPAERRLEVDDPADLEVADVLLRRRLQHDLAGALPDPVRAVVFDFDGVMTDNRVTVLQDGRESVACDRGDGMGLNLLRAAGVATLVLSSEGNPVVAARCRKLGLECLHGVRDKWPALGAWLASRGVAASETVYLGNDVNDVACLRHVGCGAAVADAHPHVLPYAKLVLTRPGGRGAVRELCDLILSARAAAAAAAATTTPRPARLAG